MWFVDCSCTDSTLKKQLGAAPLYFYTIPTSVPLFQTCCMYVVLLHAWCQLQLLLSLPLIVCCLWVLLKYQVERLIDTLLIFRKVYLPEEWDTSGVSTLYNTDGFTVQK